MKMFANRMIVSALISSISHPYAYGCEYDHDCSKFGYKGTCVLELGKSYGSCHFEKSETQQQNTSSQQPNFEGSVKAFSELAERDPEAARKVGKVLLGVLGGALVITGLLIPSEKENEIFCGYKDENPDCQDGRTFRKETESNSGIKAGLIIGGAVTLGITIAL